MVMVPQVQIPDFAGSILRGEQVGLSRLQALAQRQALDDAARFDSTLAEIAPALAAGQGPAYESAIGRLMGAGRRGFELALPLQQQAQQRREYEAWTGQGGTAPAAQPAALPPGDMTLPRGLRNNNPLNLTYVAGQPGVQGTDGRFGRYSSLEDGVAAGVRQLQMYGQRGINTLERIISTWAPPSENNTQAYIAAVARATGLDPRAPIDLNNADVVSRVVAAMGQHENGRPVPMDAVQRGVQRALSGGAAPASGDAIPAQSAMPGGAPSRTGVDPAELRRIQDGMRHPNPEIRRAAQADFQMLQFRMRDSGAEPLEAVEGPDGRPVLVPRSQAVGRTPVRLPNTVVNNNPGESAFDRERAKTLAERASDWEAAATRAAQTNSRLARFEALNRQFTTGALASQTLTAGQLAQRLGVPDGLLATLGISRDQVAAGEGLRSLTSQMLVGLIGSGGFPAQNFSNADREMLERALPALQNSPNGNAVIISILRASAERDRAIGAAWREWTRQNGESADSVRRFQSERLPGIVDPDILAPILQDAIPATDQDVAPAGPQPPAAAARPRPRARNAQGQVLEFDGNAWVPVR